MTKDERRTLGVFLRTRRERVTPEQVGITSSVRRRTSGLRREEIAQLAGLSVTWYTWIEQGREISISEAVLESIARVLQLSAQERMYLFTLAGKQPLSTQRPYTATVTPVLQHLLDHQDIYPAYLMDRYWNVVAWNTSATDLFGDFGTLPEEERNMVWYTCVLPETRQLVVGWEERAQRLVAEFRADCSGYLADAVFQRMLQRLATSSTDFSRWWAQHDVAPRDGGRRVFEHSLVGKLELEQTTLRLSAQPELKFVIHTPLGGSDSATKLQRLATLSRAT